MKNFTYALSIILFGIAVVCQASGDTLTAIFFIAMAIYNKVQFS